MGIWWELVLEPLVNGFKKDVQSNAGKAEEKKDVQVNGTTESCNAKVADVPKDCLEGDLITSSDLEHVYEGWKTINRKRQAVSPISDTNLDESPTPLNTFENLKKIDEVEAKKLDSTTGFLSKSQLKKLKRNKGRSPPPPNQPSFLC